MLGGLLLLLYFGSDSLWRLYYGVRHVDSILRYSREYRLDPHLVAALIFTESKFQEDAVSNVGAVGLMQLMPETAEEMAGEMDLPAPSLSRLQESDLNIQLGCRYLRYLSNRFDNQDLALAAYNAGPSIVEQWLDEDKGLLFPETRAYVDNVNAAESRLQRLYPDW